MNSINVNAHIVYQKRWDMLPTKTVNLQTSLGDFNHDGMIDIAVSMMDMNASTSDLKILLSQSNGSFIDGTYLIKTPAPTYQTSNILSADLNGDGFTDLIIGRSGGDGDTTNGLYADSQLIYLSDGLGGFKTIQSPTKAYIHNVMIADINGDGLVDAFFLATGIGPSIEAINQTKSSGNFLFTTEGLPDKALNSSTVDSWNVIERYSDGFIKRAQGFHQHNTAFNDVNRDGKLDMVMFFAGSQSGRIYLNSGGTIPDFSTQHYLEFNSVLTGFPSSGFYYTFDHQVGTTDYILSRIQQGTNYYESIQFDVNGDGWEDVIAVATYENRYDVNGKEISINGSDPFNHGAMYQTLINNGNGLTDETDKRIIQPTVNFHTNYHYGQYTMLSMVDLNGDGYMDFTSEQNGSGNYGLPNSAGDSDTIFMLNDGKGNFHQISIKGMEYGSYDPLPVDGKLGFIASVPPINYDWQVTKAARAYWETTFIKTDIPWTLGDQYNNHVYGTVANDLVDGGAGVDTYHAMGRIEGYLYTFLGNKILLRDVHGLEGNDTLSNVERLQFYDTSIALDIGSTQTAGSGYMLYKAAFNRTPDVGGLGYWISKMDGGMSYSDVAKNFVTSTEFKTAFGGSNPSVNTLVTKLYNNVLNRTPDAGGLAFWQDKLNTGWSTADVLGFFSTSAENVTNVTPLIANGISYTQFVG